MTLLIRPDERQDPVRRPREHREYQQGRLDAKVQRKEPGLEGGEGLPRECLEGDFGEDKGLVELGAEEG